jgi:hypothetical protein
MTICLFIFDLLSDVFSLHDKHCALIPPRGTIILYRNMGQMSIEKMGLRADGSSDILVVGGLKAQDGEFAAVRAFERDRHYCGVRPSRQKLQPLRGRLDKPHDLGLYRQFDLRIIRIVGKDVGRLPFAAEQRTLELPLPTDLLRTPRHIILTPASHDDWLLLK